MSRPAPRKVEVAGNVYDCREGDTCLYRDSRVGHRRTTGGSWCSQCDNYATPKPSEWELDVFSLYQKIFCSEECALAWREEALADPNPELCRCCNDESSVYAGICLDCFNEERSARYLPMVAPCVICAGLFIPSNGEGTCSEVCIQEARRELSHRRRAREVGAFVEDVNRHEIFKRDDYTCQLCSLPIVMSLIFPHRMSSTIDHIVPLAVGGTHEPANVQAAHFACNAAKGARIV